MGVINTHQLSTFSSPVNGTSPVDANQVRGNDNAIRSSYNAHDADATIHLQTGLVASRPSPSLSGQSWLATDTGAVYLYADTGSAWVEANYLRNTGGTITGNVSITGTLGVTGAVTGGTYNGQTITSAASFTGSVTVANGLTVTAKILQSTTSTAGGAAQTNLSGWTTPIAIVGSIANTSQDALTYQGGGGGGAAVAFRRDGSAGTLIDFYTNPTAGAIGGVVRAGGFSQTGAVDLANGLTVTTGNLGVGGATQSNVGAYIFSSALATASQIGVYSNITGTSSATTAIYGVQAVVQSAAAAYTAAAASGLYVSSIIKGAGSTITTGYGLYIENQTVAGTNYAIYTNTGPVSLGDGVTVRTGGLAVTGNSTITGTLGGITTLTATTLAGTLSTAAQPNVTSVGILASPHMTGAVVDSGGLTVTAGTSALQATTATSLNLSAGAAVTKFLTVAFTYDVPSIAANSINTVTTTVTGAAVGDAVFVDNPLINNSVVVTAYVSAADSVLLSFANPTTGAIDPPSKSYKIVVVKVS